MGSWIKNVRMLSSVDLKYWLRSGSLSFMRNRSKPRQELAAVRWNGHPIYYRPGTSDMTLIYRVLFKPEKKREYRFPAELAPKTVLDIGGNIGVTPVYLAQRFPNATIHCFEPVPENFALLEKNAAPYPNIRPHRVALGAADDERGIFFSDNPSNFGGYSFYEAGSDSGRQVKVTVRSVESYFRDVGIPQPDLIKIDTEGSEFEILKSFAPDVLSRVTWITGELHGQRDFELLDYLSKWFEISLKKELRSRLSIFEAVNRAG